MKEIENNQWIANYRTDQPHFGLERMVELLACVAIPISNSRSSISEGPMARVTIAFFEKYAGKARPESWCFQLALSHSLHRSD